MALVAEWIRDPFTRMEYELEQWGRWVRSGHGVNGYGRSVFAGIRGSTVPEPNITDTRAAALDDAVSRLHEFDAQLWGALWYTYAEGLKPYHWCRLIGVGRVTAYTRTLPAAVRWMVAEVGVAAC